MAVEPPRRERPPPPHHRPEPALHESVRPEGETAARAEPRARGALSARGAMALQRQAGNRAVSRLVAGSKSAAPSALSNGVGTTTARTSGADGGPVSSPTSTTNGAATTQAGHPSSTIGPVQRLTGARPADPRSDPKFAGLTRDVTAKKTTLAAHPPATAAAEAAQKASVPPADDKLAQGKAAQAETMNAAKPGEFDKAAFVAAVNAAIAAQAPKNLEEADDFAGSGKAEAVKGQVQGKVTDGKKTSAAAIDTATKASPDTSKAVTKPVTPLAPDRPPGTPAPPDAAAAIPDRAPPAATDFSAGPRQVEGEMAAADITEPQLATSNEPEFTDALAAKKEGEEHSATAPGEVRAVEGATLDGAKAQARIAGATAMNAMAGDRVRGGAAVQAGQQGARSSDEKRRAEATATLQKVFDATKTDVETMLTGLDKAVDEQFTREEKAARDAFTAEHKRRMDEYKDRRYSGWTGKARWVKDKFAGLPAEADQIFVTARADYVSRMQGVISGVADTVGATLGKAKARIAQGREQLQAEVKKLPADLRQFGIEAAGEFAGKFDELTESVDSTSQELVQTLATKYSAALTAVDEEIDAAQAANKGLISKAVDAVKGVVKTILALKDLLLGVLAKAASAIAAILKDPIGFLGNLVSAVGAGLRAFMANIGTHLKTGLVGWLLGAVSSMGIQMPARFDLRGIIGMIASLLGLTWGAIRGRIVSRGVPEQAMSAVEQSEPMAQKLQSEGVAGIWETIKEKVGDLKEGLLSKITEYLIPTVLIAGITWIISLLNPASAFVKAVKMIVDIVTFIVERGAQIAAFVNSVLDAVVAIAGGGGGGVPGLIEKALAGSIPVLIGALAAFLGIGGIADKVKTFFQSLSKPVMKAVDWVADKLVKFGKKVWGKLKAGAQTLKNKVTGQGRKVPDAGDRPARLRGAVADVRAAMAAPGADLETVRAGLPVIQQKYDLTSLELVKDAEHRYHPHAVINPTIDGPKGVLFTAQELVGLDQEAQRYAAQIKARPGDRTLFLADPVGYLTPGPKGQLKVDIGRSVEVAATPALTAMADEAGLTLIVNPYLQFSDAAGTVVGGRGPELDFLLLGRGAVHEIASAKLSPGSFKPKQDRKNLAHFYTLPTAPQADLVAYLNTHFGRNRLFATVTSVHVVSSQGRETLDAFRARARLLAPVSQITVTPVLPAPDSPGGVHLRATSVELLAKVAELTKKYL